MTDRIHSFLVVLDKDLRDDDAAPIAAAIRQLRGVIRVTANVADMNSVMAEERAVNFLRIKLIEVLYPKTP